MEEEKAAKLYQQTIDYLRKKGLERYEISNFAMNEYNQSRHNLVYWQGGDYIGIGDGAHGRFQNNGKIYSTLDGQIDSILTPQERAEELLIMGLRIKNGINFAEFSHHCGLNFFDCVNNLSIKKLANLNLLCYDADKIWLTDKGFLLLDKITLELVS